MKTATKTRFKQTELGKSPELVASDEWRQARLAEICVHSAFGPRFSGRLYAADGNVATLRTTDISEDGRIEYATMPLARLPLSKLQQHLLQKDDLVVTRTGRVGTTAVFDGFRLPVLAGAFLIRFRLNRELADPNFYRYYFNSPEGHALTTSVATGSVQQNLNITSLHGLVIPVPPLREQRVIAHILGTLDDKIELNHQMNKTLESIGKEIFKHWFIDFEFPNEEGKPYRSSGGEMVYSEELEKEVPKGWEVKPFSEVIAINPKRELEHGHVAKKVGMADLNPWQAHIENWTCEEYKSGPKFKNGDTLFARITPSLEHGKTAFVSTLDDNEVGFGSTEFIIFGKKVISSALYIFHLSRSEEIRKIAIGAMTGTSGRQRVPDNLFDSLRMIIPLSALVDRFEAVVSPQFNRITRNAKETRTLSQIRDSLLPKLMSGKIRVPVEVR